MKLSSLQPGTKLGVTMDNTCAIRPLQMLWMANSSNTAYSQNKKNVVQNKALIQMKKILL